MSIVDLKRANELRKKQWIFWSFWKEIFTNKFSWFFSRQHKPAITEIPTTCLKLVYFFEKSNYSFGKRQQKNNSWNFFGSQWHSWRWWVNTDYFVWKNMMIFFLQYLNWGVSLLIPYVCYQKLLKRELFLRKNSVLRLWNCHYYICLWRTCDEKILSLRGQHFSFIAFSGNNLTAYLLLAFVSSRISVILKSYFPFNSFLTCFEWNEWIATTCNTRHILS